VHAVTQFVCAVVQLALQPSSLHFAVHEVSVSSQVLVHIVSVSFAFSSTLGFETLAVHPIAADAIIDARTKTLLWNLVISKTPLQKARQSRRGGGPEQ
jgi:hypothetical protein